MTRVLPLLNRFVSILVPARLADGTRVRAAFGVSVSHIPERSALAVGNPCGTSVELACDSPCYQQPL